jgi:two-component system response regulator FixJ
LTKTVHIIDDEAVVRDSLATLLARNGYITRTFASPRVFLNVVTAEDRGCVLIDLKLPGMTGLELLRELRGRGIGLPAVMITGHGNIQAAVEAMKAGVIDFLEKPFTNASLLSAVGTALKPEAEAETVAVKRESLGSLTPRERDVLKHLLTGMTSREIGAALGISVRTIDVYRRSLLVKLEARNTADLVRIALAANFNAGA